MLSSAGSCCGSVPHTVSGNGALASISHPGPHALPTLTGPGADPTKEAQRVLTETMTAGVCLVRMRGRLCARAGLTYILAQSRKQHTKVRGPELCSQRGVAWGQIQELPVPFLVARDWPRPFIDLSRAVSQNLLLLGTECGEETTDPSLRPPGTSFLVKH